MAISPLPEIKDLDRLLKIPKCQIVAQNICRLTVPGENYGSLMLSVEIRLKTEKGYEDIHAVAKMVPPNDFIQEVFNTQVTFPNEVGFYQSIIPTLEHFQREQGLDKAVIDFAPKYFGSRLNLTGGEKVDSDAVLLLENLKVANFVNLDRTTGFNLDAAKLVVADLAHLHAIPIALKLKKPQVFLEKVKPYLTPFIEKEEVHNNIKEQLIKLVDSLKECKPFLARIHRALDIFPYNGVPREPFATITHNDCWVNNTMQQLKDGKPIKNKIVDFQICDYGSPAKDLLFFLFSSVQNEVLLQYYEALVNLYHNVFIGILSKLGCDTSPFSFDHFQKEINYEAKHSQFFHTTVMLFPIFAPKGSVKEISELSPDDLINMEATDLHKEKLIIIVNEFAKRNWI